MDLYRQNIVIGCMEFLVMRHPVQDIGHVGTELQQVSYQKKQD